MTAAVSSILEKTSLKIQDDAGGVPIVLSSRSR